MSDATIARAAACCIHMYKQLVIESDGDSFVERQRRRGAGVGWRGGRENMKPPPNSPKNNLQLWMNTLSQSNFDSVDVCVCASKTVEC